MSNTSTLSPGVTPHHFRSLGVMWILYCLPSVPSRRNRYETLRRTSSSTMKCDPPTMLTLYFTAISVKSVRSEDAIPSELSGFLYVVYDPDDLSRSLPHLRRMARRYVRTAGAER